MGIDKIIKAVFLDRDGVINEPVYNRKTGELEPPHDIKDLKLYDWTIESLKRFQNMDYLMFVVSNQPDYAKGKTTLENLKNVHNELIKIFERNGIMFREYFYCYHHPEGIIPEYSIKCDCRKPSNANVMRAIKNYNININLSWFIGDRDSDIICGKDSGLKTIFINEKNLNHNLADFNVKNLKEVAEIISQNKNLRNDTKSGKTEN